MTFSSRATWLLSHCVSHSVTFLFSVSKQPLMPLPNSLQPLANSLLLLPNLLLPRPNSWLPLLNSWLPLPNSWLPLPNSWLPCPTHDCPAQLITAPAQLITAPAQPPATRAAVYTALFYKNCFFLQVAIVFFQLSWRFPMEKLSVDNPNGSLQQ